MTIIFTNSADRHMVPHDDMIYAMLHTSGMQREADDGGDLIVFVGRAHAQTDRHLEVIARAVGGDIVVFHAMELSDSYRHLAQKET